jgi:hypothetical protein
VRVPAHRVVSEYIDGLVRYASAAGQAVYGEHPVDMTPMTFVSGALNALAGVGAITESERAELVLRCQDAFGLERAPEAASADSEAPYEPRWAERPPGPP